MTTIVNNRPDGEEPGQPANAAIEAAAQAAGLDYRFIPVAGGFPPEQVAAMAAAVAETEGKLLAFCRSGRALGAFVGARDGQGNFARVIGQARHKGAWPRPSASSIAIRPSRSAARRRARSG